MTLCQHIIKGASFAALMLTSPPHRLGRMAVSYWKRLQSLSADCVLCPPSKGRAEYNVLTFVIGFESAENIEMTCALLISRYRLTSSHSQ